MRKFRVGDRVKTVIEEATVKGVYDEALSLVVPGNAPVAAVIYTDMPGVTVELLPEPVPTPHDGDVLYQGKETLVYSHVTGGWVFPATGLRAKGTAILLERGWQWLKLHGEPVR